MRFLRAALLTLPSLTIAVCVLGSAAPQAAQAQGTNPCTPAQCATLLQGNFRCGSAAPYACVTTGGCYDSSTAATSGCPNNWCYFGPCAMPASTQPTRTVTFINNCSEPFPVYQDATQIIASLANNGVAQSVTVTLTSATNDWGQTYYQSGTGLAFRAMPDDEDLSNSTLFEVNFGAYQGASDVYDVSAIPPSSCAGHMQTTDNDYGYADHLPFKNASSPTQSWACLPSASGSPDCGDGLGWQLCPAVTGSATVAATVQPPAAQQGNPVVYGCGVPGEQCCDPSSPTGTCTPKTVSGGCCPNVCAVTGTESATAPGVRDLVHNCAYQQSVTVAKNLGSLTKKQTVPRQTGYWKAVQAIPVWPTGQQPGAGCINLTCSAGGTESAPTFNAMAETCADGYLWPYDDASATVTCNAAPNYQVTFCPGSTPKAAVKKKS